MGLASVGLRSRRLRAALSATGVAIGIAAMVAVLGISASSQAALLGQLDRLGANLLTVAPGQTLGGDDATLPASVMAMSAASRRWRRRRSRPTPTRRCTAATASASAETGGIAVRAADVDLAATLGPRWPGAPS